MAVPVVDMPLEVGVHRLQRLAGRAPVGRPVACHRSILARRQRTSVPLTRSSRAWRCTPDEERQDRKAPSGTAGWPAGLVALPHDRRRYRGFLLRPRRHIAARACDHLIEGAGRPGVKVADEHVLDPAVGKAAFGQVRTPETTNITGAVAHKP